MKLRLRLIVRFAPTAVVQRGFQTSDWDGYKEERSRGFHNGSVVAGTRNHRYRHSLMVAI